MAHLTGNWLFTIQDSGPAGPETLPFWAGYRLPAGKYTGILTDFQTKVKKKRPKMHFFWPPFFLLKSELYPL